MVGKRIFVQLSAVLRKMNGECWIHFAEAKNDHGMKIDLETCHVACGPTMKRKTND